MDITKPLENLKQKRKAYNSEADFQFALAWEIQLCYPLANVRLECCPRENPNMHIDILVQINSNFYPIELKYKTLKEEIMIEGESFYLKSHGAQDEGKYDFLLDVSRIEQLSSNLTNYKKGYVIWLTNDPSYWSPPRRKNTIYEKFSVHDNAVKTGLLSWAPHAGIGTTKGRTSPINLKNTYTINWNEYSKVSERRGGNFKYSVLSIPPAKSTG